MFASPGGCSIKLLVGGQNQAGIRIRAVGEIEGRQSLQLARRRHFKNCAAVIRAGRRGPASFRSAIEVAVHTLGQRLVIGERSVGAIEAGESPKGLSV